MDSSKSFLSDRIYGYDFVVATTQDSINSTLKNFLQRVRELVVAVCCRNVWEDSDED